jgi:glucan phosphoethanolaminetransferase (alkaline phosphatase superfamily)
MVRMAMIYFKKVTPGGTQTHSLLPSLLNILLENFNQKEKHKQERLVKIIGRRTIRLSLFEHK